LDIKNKKALVVGLGRSGIETVLFLKKRGALVTATDTATENEMEDSMNRLYGMDVIYELGSHRMDTFLSSDFIIVSPGVPTTIPPMAAAREKGIPVIGELELASRFISDPLIAITGTNGKTTTTELVGAMLKASGKRVFVGGNIGSPLIGYADGQEKSDCVVIEVSSFQLDTIETFKPDISVLLNITPDHLDRYADFRDYVDSKGRIFRNQTAKDTAILNGSDSWVRRLCGQIAAETLFFTGRLDHEQGAGITDAGIDLCLQPQGTDIGNGRVSPGSERIYFPPGRKDLACRHIQENASAACLAALTGGATRKGIQEALNAYNGLPHRMEYIGTIGNSPYYNDSKATNVDAVLRALECLEGPIVLIMGGRNKGSDFSLLADDIQQKVSTLILLGEATEEIAEGLQGLTNTKKVNSMNQAVVESCASATAGETVLFSPACASFDMYENYKERGESFREAVKQLRRQEMK
jgi:UDP-N-acetylmuramoylalanine--D-glutamate ligase